MHIHTECTERNIINSFCHKKRKKKKEKKEMDLLEEHMIYEKVKLGKVAFGPTTSNVLVSDNYPTPSARDSNYINIQPLILLISPNHVLLKRKPKFFPIHVRLVHVRIHIPHLLRDPVYSLALVRFFNRCGTLESISFRALEPSVLVNTGSLLQSMRDPPIHSIRGLASSHSGL